MGGDAGSESEMEVLGAKTGEVIDAVEGVEGRRANEGGWGEIGDSAVERGGRVGLGSGCGLDSGSDSMLSLKPLDEFALGGS